MRKVLKVFVLRLGWLVYWVASKLWTTRKVVQPLNFCERAHSST